MNGALLIGVGLLMLAWNKRTAKTQDLTDDDLPLNESSYIDANTHNEPEIPGVTVHPILLANTVGMLRGDYDTSLRSDYGWGLKGKSGIWLENASNKTVYIFKIVIDVELNKQPMYILSGNDTMTYYGWEPLEILPQRGKVIFTPGTTQLQIMPDYGMLATYTKTPISEDTLQMTLAAMRKMRVSDKLMEQYKKHADRASNFARSNIRIFWGYNKSDWKESSKDNRRYEIAYYPNIPTIIYGE